jgi:hypothetical protein
MRESDWTRDFCKDLEAVGCIVVPHVMNQMSCNTPDRTVVTKYGNYFVEFKGLKTKWRDGQRILAGRMNSRYPCSFVYRYPGVLSIFDYQCEVTDPREFVEALKRMTEHCLRPRDTCTNS